jgi:hypothetical protein
MADFAPVPQLRAPPTTAAGLAAEIRRIHEESARYWAAYATPEFFRRPKPDVWAPVDQVRHLSKSMRAVTRGLTIPRLFLLLRFGWSRRPSRTFEALQADYKDALARGGRAGRFGPAPLDAAEETEKGRARIMELHATTVESFAGALDGWSDDSLERYVLPHPLLGKLTVREMMYFTLIHNVHHVQVAERRRREPA